MSCRVADLRRLVVAVALAWIAGLATPVRAGEDPRTVALFLQELKSHGLHEVAIDYIRELRNDPTLPADVKTGLDYEEGRTLVDEASHSNDLVLREELLRDAREKLDQFIKNNPNRPEVPDALVQKSKLLVERGYLAMLLADETEDKAKKDAKIAEARSAFLDAHEAYGKAVIGLAKAKDRFPISLAEKDPRRAIRDKLIASYLDGMLQQGVCSYELAQTYPAGSAERTKYLDEALKQFETLRNAHRLQFAGLAAQMWQAKCFEEKGDIGSAIGLYKLLLDNSDPRLRPLNRHVGYFYIVALSKRKEFALAADQAGNWLRTFNRRDEIRSKEGLGVQLELAKAIDAQMPTIGEGEKPAAQKKIVDTLAQVVRFSSPFKNEALTLLRKYKPKAAMKAEEISRLTFQDAMEKADEAMSQKDWDRAILLLKAAVAKANPVTEIDKLHLARYNLSFCYYMTRQFYEADVLAEHLARRYPHAGLAPKATLIGMQALVDAYNTYTEVDRTTDINSVVDLAKYTAETWPDREEGNDARLNLGIIYLGRGQYDRAIASLEAIKRRSGIWLEAQSRLGGAHWAKSRAMEARGNPTEAAAEARKATDVLKGALKARREANASATDPGFVGNVGDLAIVLSESGKPQEALQLLGPVVQAQKIRSGPGFSRLMEAQLMALISTNQVQPAIATMKTLEQAGGGASLTQLYLKLGRLLERELEAIKKKGNTVAFARMHQSYKAFLTTLAAAKSGQTYESLQWAGERLLELQAYKDADVVFRRVLAEYGQNPQFLQRPGSQNSMLRTRLKLAAALRGEGLFEEASSLVEELLKRYPKYIEPQFEKGLLLEAEAEARRGTWPASQRYWQTLARKLERVRPRRADYYEAWYHVAWALYREGKIVPARQTLQGIVRLTPGVGSPEMKARYEALIVSLSKK